MTAQPVTIETRGHVGTVWLDRPESRNAMAPDFWDAFPTAVEEVAAERSTRAIVIAARGTAFTVGLDLKAFGEDLTSAGDSVAARRATHAEIKRMQRTFSCLADAAQPVIAAIHGYCIGAGVDLVTACDIRLASRDAVFSVRETRVGLVADVGTLQRLPTIVDPGRAADMVYTGRDVAAEEALAMGLVSAIHEDAEAVRKAAMETAELIADNSPLAVQGAKAILRAGRGRAVDEGLEHVALWNAAFMHSDDLAEAIAAFSEKRVPRFEGH